MKRLVIYLFLASVSIAPSISPNDNYLIKSGDIYKHISVLADDSLEGRRVGDPGELKAAKYIAGQFSKSNLLPYGDSGSFFQTFTFTRSIDLGTNNRLVLNGVELELNADFIPLTQSSSQSFSFDNVIFADYGIVTENKSYNDYENIDATDKAVIVKRFAPSADDNPHIDFDNYSSINDKIIFAQDNKAAAIFLYTPEDKDDTLLQNITSHISPKDIPVIFIRKKAFEKLNLDLNNPAIISATGQTELIKTIDTAYNVVGYLPGKSDTTIIIGAHYDHLGWGGHSSLCTDQEPMIHNGADDNASGVSALIELAAYYNPLRESNRFSILFIAFTGEEFGLLGAANYAQNMTVDSSKVRMMINMDMIGRLSEQEDGLAVLGTGSCDEFKLYFDSLNYDDIHLSLKESASGPSDQTVFYNRKIPSLHLFTGAHKDYHKPSDDIDKIDTEGVVKVTRFVNHTINYFDNIEGTLTFKKTKDAGEGKRRSQFSVTLGIMPDYIADVKGVKVDGVTPEKPAERAGMLEGDIIIKMGDKDINDIYDYMTSLSKFRKGDSTKITVQRGENTLTLDVVFE